MLLCQNDRHRNPMSLIQYPEVVLVVGYIMLGTLAAFGLVSALWVLYGFLLPAERGGGLYAPARPGVTEDSSGCGSWGCCGKSLPWWILASAMPNGTG